MVHVSAESALIRRSHFHGYNDINTRHVSGKVAAEEPGIIPIYLIRDSVIRDDLYM